MALSPRVSICWLAPDLGCIDPETSRSQEIDNPLPKTLSIRTSP